MAIKPHINASKVPTDSTAVEPPAKATLAASRDATALPTSGYLTADWVKRRYAISNSTLYKWLSENRFPRPVRIGPRAVRWRADDLAAFEASRQVAE